MLPVIAGLFIRLASRIGKFGQLFVILGHRTVLIFRPLFAPDGVAYRHGPQPSRMLG